MRAPRATRRETAIFATPPPKRRVLRSYIARAICHFEKIISKPIQKSNRRGALFAARKRSGRKAASNGSWRSLSFVRFLRSRLETIFVDLVSQASAAITGCVQDASYACKKRTPHSLHFRFSAFPVALQAAKSLPALMVGVSGRAAQNVPVCALPQPSSLPRVRQILVVVRLLS